MEPYVQLCISRPPRASAPTRAHRVCFRLSIFSHLLSLAAGARRKLFPALHESTSSFLAPCGNHEHAAGSQPAGIELRPALF